MFVVRESFSKPGKYEHIYRALADDLSKEVFRDRLLYSLIRDKDIIRDMIFRSAGVSREQSRSKICFFGAGGCGSDFLREPCVWDIPFVIDSYRRGEVRGKPVISPEQFFAMPDHREYLIVITVGKRYEKEIADLLKEHQQHFIFANLGKQYFDLPQLALNNEFFVDAGALDGETTELFFQHCPDGFAYAFEPDPPQFSVTADHLRSFGKKVKVFPYGLSDENASVRFIPSIKGEMGSSLIDPTGSLEIETCKLDDLLGDHPVTFIKMDIEGAELAALRGAESIIRKQKPKLAICVYHKPEDIWEIPDQILQYNPEYKLYLRHYTALYDDTVLYAI